MCSKCGNHFEEYTLILTPLLTVFGQVFAWVNLCHDCNATIVASNRKLEIIWARKNLNKGGYI